jgi:ribosomal-protein-alanine N-acetyltransferase
MELAYPSPELTDGTVALRAWSDADVDCIREAAEDPDIPAGTTVPAVFSPGAAQAFIDRQRGRLEAGEGISLAIVELATDRAAGLVWLPLRPQAGVAGLGYWVIPSARRRGLATRAVRLIATWALRRPDIARVEAWVQTDNAPSQRLLVSAGFTQEGVLRSFLTVGGRRADAVVFSRTAQDAG